MTAADDDQALALDRTMTSAGGSPAPTTTDPMVGRQLAHFVLERRIGQGGMGEVYLAHDLALDRQVAVKILGRDIAQRPALRERFVREARAQARIQHPNVCHIYYIGEEAREGLLFFAMELIDGETLQERLDAGPLAAEEAVEACRMAALGLREAQRHGFTHRDIKPSNLMVDRHGTLKLLDFGIAKQEAPAPGTPELTGQGGELIGTPLYMAPEQGRGGPIDFRADIYALGVTLHQLISGRPPFSGDSPMQVFSQHLTERRPRFELARAERPHAPALDELVDRMMAKDPAERFTGYDDLIAALERVSPARTRPAGFWVRASAAALDFFLISLFVVLIERFVEIADEPLMLAAGAVYSIAFHARGGRTPGKMAFEIEVVPRDRAGPPTLWAATLRVLGQLGPTIALAVAIAVLVHNGALATEGPLFGLLVASTFAMPLVLGLTALLSPRRLAPWDRLARTQVRYRPRGPTLAKQARP